MLTLTFPTNHTLDTVVQEYVADTDNFVGAQILPEDTSEFQKVRWDERDRDRGMTAAHVMGTDPKTDTRQGSKTHEYEPIPFKETDVLREDEILRQRELGTLNQTLDLGAEIARITKNRLDKTRIRMEQLRWDTLRGAIAINENGVVVNETFAGVQKPTPLVDWDDLDNATPLKDLNAWKLLFRGTGATAQGAKLYINQTTANWLLENNNPDDLKGFQNSNFVHLPYSIDEVNKILTARGLPTIHVVEDGYVDEGDNFVNFVDDAEAFLVGKRPAGQKIGDWLSTPSLHRTVNGKQAPGYFSIVEVNGQPSDTVGAVSMSQLGQSKNPKVEITGGIYGGTRLFYPRSIIYCGVAS
jgi:hypothetical protein